MDESSERPSAGGVARRRRERRMRSWWRHEQQFIRMALGAAAHHSAQQHAALRGPKTGTRAPGAAAERPQLAALRRGWPAAARHAVSGEHCERGRGLRHSRLPPLSVAGGEGAGGAEEEKGGG